MLPIFHVHGLFVASHGALLAGARMIWLPRLDVEQALHYLPRCTVMMGVPTYYVRLLADPRFNRAACARMSLFISGSAPLLMESRSEEHTSELQSLMRISYAVFSMNINKIP